ncbi:hypothetical protein ACI39V_28375, partial [Klebsiella pneumoniae]
GSTGKTCEGQASNVLGGPLHALAFLVREIDRFGYPDPLRAGELVTTGTLTEAPPIAAGETWTAAFDGIPLVMPPVTIC